VPLVGDSADGETGTVIGFTGSREQAGSFVPHPAGSGEELRQERGQGAGACLHPGATLPVGLGGSSRLQARDRGTRDPVGPPFRFLVCPVGDVSVERAHGEDRRGDVRAGVAVQRGGQSFSPGDGHVRGQVQVALVRVDLQDLGPEEAHEPVGQCLERPVVHAGLDLVEVGDQEVAHA
jgi:hypothetical protein